MNPKRTFFPPDRDPAQAPSSRDARSANRGSQATRLRELKNLRIVVLRSRSRWSGRKIISSNVFQEHPTAEGMKDGDPGDVAAPMRARKILESRLERRREVAGSNQIGIGAGLPDPRRVSRVHPRDDRPQLAREYDASLGEE